MGKRKNPIGHNPSEAHVPKHGGPVAGDGFHRSRLGSIKGVIFRLANGKPALPPKGGKK
jgi:hypothetical protein